MRRRGLERAAELERSRWRERFGGLVEDLLDAGARPYREEVEVKPRSTSRSVAAGSGTLFVPVRVINRGSHVLAAQGAGRYVLRYCLREEAGGQGVGVGGATELPGLVMPGRAAAAAVPVAVPEVPGQYRLAFWAERCGAAEGLAGGEKRTGSSLTQEGILLLNVTGREAGQGEGCCAPLLEAIQSALVSAQRCRQLPVEYADVTEGSLAGWKRWLKRKLLGNFKRAYVDVLSRQQSLFNQAVLSALEELADCCATLDHKGQRTVAAGGKKDAPGWEMLVEALARELADTRQHCVDLEERLAQLEEQVKLAAKANCAE